MDKKTIKYSVIVPVYNSEDTLEELHRRLTSTFKSIPFNYELIFVDDYSIDSSWDILRFIKKNNSNVRIIRLARNFGQHNATLCGFYYSKGEFVITLDDDLQNPPEEILKLISKVNDGFYVVYGKYPTKYHSKFENFLSNIFQHIIKKTLGVPSEITTSSFVIYRKKVIDNILKVKNSYPQLAALTIKNTPINKITNVIVEHRERKIGKSNYSLIRYIPMLLNLIINYTSIPLLLVAIFGFFSSISSIIYAMYIVFNYLCIPSYGVMGWNSLMVAITLLGGSILMSVAIVGEYLRRILTEVSYGQQYLVDKAEL